MKLLSVAFILILTALAPIAIPEEGDPIPCPGCAIGIDGDVGAPIDITIELSGIGANHGMCSWYIEITEWFCWEWVGCHLEFWVTIEDHSKTGEWTEVKVVGPEGSYTHSLPGSGYTWDSNVDADQRVGCGENTIKYEIYVKSALQQPPTWRHVCDIKCFECDG